MLKVRLYRPFSERHFLEVLPSTVRKIAVLDRTKEPGSPGEPLYLDVVKACQLLDSPPQIVGGRYGLGSKDTTPSQIMAVFDNLQQDEPKDRFTIGINDDLTFTSLPEGEHIDVTPEGTIGCKFWGLGSDGTVGANQEAIRIIGDHTDTYVQAYFFYDSKNRVGPPSPTSVSGKSPSKPRIWWTAPITLPATTRPLCALRPAQGNQARWHLCSELSLGRGRTGREPSRGNQADLGPKESAVLHHRRH